MRGACALRPAATPPSAAVADVAPVTPMARRLASTDAPLRYVNPFIGTRGPNPTSPEYGGTLPAVTRPFGMTQWTAMTRQNRIGVNPYHYDDGHMEGFLGTHQPAIWMGDYGYVSLMPGTGEIAITRRAPSGNSHRSTAIRRTRATRSRPSGR